jgi:mannose/fructose/N-acetylgalactosamine-specific phosphotransferase system component IIC
MVLMMLTMMVTIIFIDDVDNDIENDDMTRLIRMMTMDMFYILLMRMLLMINRMRSMMMSMIFTRPLLLVVKLI